METHLLPDLALVMAVAAFTTLLCHWLRQPVVLGYLIAGLIIGPYTPPFALVKDLQSIQTMAELGLIFLMFALGLEFNLPKLGRVGLSALAAAALEIAGMLWIGYEVGLLFGWSRMDSIFLGAVLSMSSTTIIVKVFMDMKLMHEKFAQVVFGILILEDIAAILILSILSALGASGHADTALAVRTSLKIGFFVAFFIIFGLLLVPRFLGMVGRLRSKETLGIVTLGLCLSSAILAEHFGFSVALGAFLMGAVIAAAKEAEQIEEWFHPVRDMFSAIFFVSAGMLLQPQMLVLYKWPILVVTVVTILGKVATVSAGSFLAGFGMKTSFRIGASMGQIGEFSFVIASLGAATGVTSDFLYPLVVTVSFLTTFLTPYLIRHSDGLVAGMAAVIPSSLQRGMERYETWLQGTAKREGSPETMIFSKYLIRLMVYVIVWSGAIILARMVSFGMGTPLAVWSVTAILLLPLFQVISKYISHVLLLWATRSSDADEPPFVLKYLNVHYFYNFLSFSTMAVMGFIFLSFAKDYISSYAALAGIAAGAWLIGFLFRRAVTAAKEWIEALLDEVLGLATSEPTRKAVISEHQSFLSERVEEVMLPKNAAALHRKIRDLNLRERTQVTIVSIYRHGTHIASPAPDQELQANDILVLLGEPHQRQAAVSLLLKGNS